MNTYDPQTPVPPPASHPQQQTYGRTALILGCIGAPLAFVPIVGLVALPVVIVGMTLGIVALKQIKKGLATNERTAWAGIALCAVGLVVCLFGGPGGTGPQQGQGDAGGGAAVSEPQYPSSEHENAWESAQSYLRSGNFSERGLIEQLSAQAGDQYPRDVAAWAVANVHADWNAEALEAAESYMDSGSFSRAELHDQLTSEVADQFTTEQADYAIANLGR